MSGEETKQKVVLITGCSSGIGFETALEFARKGYKTYATMRNLDKKSELENKTNNENLNLDILQIDVNKQETIDNAINEIKNKENRIDILVNNAGYGSMGSIENYSLEEIREQFETGLFGPIRMIKAVLPFMKEQKSGNITSISSVAGQIGFPLSSAHVSSKFALEGLIDSLRLELSLYGITLTLIEPGVVKSKFHENMKIVEASINPTFKAMTEKILENSKSLFEKGLEPSEVAEKIFEISQLEKPKIRYSIGELADLFLENKERMTGAEFDKFIQDVYKEILES